MEASIYELEEHFLRLLELAHAGEDVIITKAGKPYVRFVSILRSTPRTPPASLSKSTRHADSNQHVKFPLRERVPGLLKGKVEDTFFEPLPEEVRFLDCINYKKNF